MVALAGRPVSGLVCHSVVVAAATGWQIAIVVVVGPGPVVHRPMGPRRVYRAVRHRFSPSLGRIRADSSERENYESTGEKLQHVEILLASPFANEVDVRQFRSPPNPHPKAFQSRGPGQSRTTNSHKPEVRAPVREPERVGEGSTGKGQLFARHNCKAVDATGA